MSFNNLIKIAVSIKQLEDNVQRAKDKGLIHTGAPTDTHTPLTDKAFDSLPEKVKNVFT